MVDSYDGFELPTQDPTTWYFDGLQMSRTEVRVHAGPLAAPAASLPRLPRLPPFPRISRIHLLNMRGFFCLPKIPPHPSHGLLTPPPSPPLTPGSPHPRRRCRVHPLCNISHHTHTVMPCTRPATPTRASGHAPSRRTRFRTPYPAAPPLLPLRSPERRRPPWPSTPPPSTHTWMDHARRIPRQEFPDLERAKETYT